MAELVREDPHVALDMQKSLGYQKKLPEIQP